MISHPGSLWSSLPAAAALDVRPWPTAPRDAPPPTREATSNASGPRCREDGNHAPTVPRIGVGPPASRPCFSLQAERDGAGMAVQKIFGSSAVDGDGATAPQIIRAINGEWIDQLRILKFRRAPRRCGRGR